MENPWKTLGSREVYRNPWLTLREDQVIRPDGQEGIYGVIDTRIATGVCALTPKRELYLVGQYRYPTQCYSWEIVEGGSDPGEDYLDTMKRELREEAGLLAARWTPLGHEIHISNCISSEMCYIYLAEDLTVTDAEPEATEVLQLRKAPLAECLAMVDRGEIVDAVSILGIVLLDRHLRSRSAG